MSCGRCRPARTPRSGRDSARLANVASITAEGQDITLTLTQPDSSLLWNLTGRAGLILKEGDTVDYQTARERHRPVHADDWMQGDSITFARNDDYWGDKAQVAEVVFDYIPDNQAALNAALAGEVDVLTGFDANLKEQIEANGDFTLELGKSTDKGTLAFNQAAGSPLADKRVRQAIRQAIDHDAIIEALASGQTQYGPIPELDPGYEDLSDVAPFDPEAAKALLADAGVEDLTLTLTIPNFYSTDDPADPRLEPQRGRHHARGQLGRLPDVAQRRLHQQGLRPVASCCTPRRATSRTGPTRTTTSPTTTPRCRTCTRSPSPRPTRTKPPTCSSRPRASSSEDAAADWLYNGASVVAVGTNIAGMPTTNVNERLNLAELDQERRVIRYTLTRLALLLLGLFVASVLIFLTLRVLPGDVAQLIAGINSTPEQVEAIRERLGLTSRSRCSTSSGSAASSAATSALRCSPDRA